MAIDISNDPFLESEVERLLAPYRAILPPSALEEFRDVLIDSLTAHPVGAEMISALRPRQPNIKSGDQPIEGASDSMDESIDDEAAGGTR